MTSDAIEERLQRLAKAYAFAPAVLWLIAQVRALRQRIAEVEQERKLLAKGLDDIARGMMPQSVGGHLNTDTPAEFRSRMWAWSRTRAREALRAHEPPGRGEEGESGDG